jgi:hypothetical protein
MDTPFLFILKRGAIGNEGLRTNGFGYKEKD